MISSLPFLVGLMLPSAPAAAAQLPAGAPQTESRYEVYLLTVDQGDAVWEQFGHNALLIRDRATGEETAWNWGLFNFDDVDFLPRFLGGSMRYSMGPVDPAALLASYIASNRTVYRNRVSLTQEEAQELDALVRENFEPENRAYTYHYFRDNCSTRIRDALDAVLGGLLRRTFAGRPSHSYRWHTGRLVQGTPWIDQGLSFLLGTRGDVPRSEWDAMFVPMEMMRLVEEVERRDGPGGVRPLLGPRDTLFLASRDPAPAMPPILSPIWLALGVVMGGTIGALGQLAVRGRRWAAWGTAAGIAAWGTFSAILGGILVMAWFTDHDFIQRNVNLFYLSPAGILLAAASVVALKHGWARSAAAWTATAIAALSVLALLFEATPLIDQGNGEVIALALPVNLAAAWTLHRAPRRP